uniref:Fibronectin type-III domain-containing protein n=1 Tax=Esox lucius TaxID=8010 RepID=A0A3P8XKL9_ESOLU
MDELLLVFLGHQALDCGYIFKMIECCFGDHFDMTGPRIHVLFLEECSTYLQEKGDAVVNRLEYKMTDRFSTLKTRLVHQNKTFEQEHDLKDKVKLYPPANLSLVMSEAPELNLSWNHSRIHHCFESEVRYRINNDKCTSPRREWTYTVHFLSESRYEFQVRTRIHDGCGESKFWSEWSQIILWDSMKGNYTTEQCNYLFCPVSLSQTYLCETLLLFVGTLVLLMLACMLVYWEGGIGLPHISKHISFQPNFTELTCSVSEYTWIPLTGSISESESNLSNPTNQSDCLSSCSSSASTLPDK